MKKEHYKKIDPTKYCIAINTHYIKDPNYNVIWSFEKKCIIPKNYNEDKENKCFLCEYFSEIDDCQIEFDDDPVSVEKYYAYCEHNKYDGKFDICQCEQSNEVNQCDN
ncbi:hypothetical protein Catovirus_1_36 [Catovirus CTV1]|uniref:Uncharacterized protein n=1 Tax=Catovirus CTV1 TaxID=1977631 RepID=A0A1V0S8G5_9VIRU|nr:hypothetical protein Catovirus_1_36 [Catovirus CTV1]